MQTQRLMLFSSHFVCFNIHLQKKGTRRRQESYKFAYLTMTNNNFARAFFILVLFRAVLVQSTTWNHLLSTCGRLVLLAATFQFFFPSPNRIVRTHFERVKSCSNWHIWSERQGFIFRWRPRYHRHFPCIKLVLLLLTKRRADVAAKLHSRDLGW